jgi:hypothetical protein
LILNSLKGRKFNANNKVLREKLSLKQGCCRRIFLVEIILILPLKKQLMKTMSFTIKKNKETGKDSKLSVRNNSDKNNMRKDRLRYGLKRSLFPRKTRVRILQ